MILVVGATGLLGSEICSRLRARNLQLRALVRPASRNADRLRDLGVEIVAGDIRVASDLQRACKGVSTIISTATAMGSKDKSLTLRDVDQRGQLALVEAAESNGVKRFIFVSAAAALSSAAPLVRYKREVEAALRRSSMRWTILQPSVFMEVWLSGELGWNIAEGKATLFGPGTAPMSWVSVADVAECAVRVLDDDHFFDKVLPIGGPSSPCALEVVQLFERLSGRRFKRTHVPLLLLRVMRPLAALFNEQIASGMAMAAQTEAGVINDLSLQRTLGIEFTSIEQYAARVLRFSVRPASPAPSPTSS